MESTMERLTSKWAVKNMYEKYKSRFQTKNYVPLLNYEAFIILKLQYLHLVIWHEQADKCNQNNSIFLQNQKFPESLEKYVHNRWII